MPFKMVLKLTRSQMNLLGAIVLLRMCVRVCVLVRLRTLHKQRREAGVELHVTVPERIRV